jgi:VWFA-related protein
MCREEEEWTMTRKLIWSFLCSLICLPVGAAQSTPSQPETALRTSADLVVVDVTVDDRQQNPVHQLGASDFTVLEDGKPQTIKIFEEHAMSAVAPLPPAPRLEPGTFTNYSPVPANRALDILLFDELNTPMTAQAAVRNQVLKFLKEAPPGTHMAIFSLTTELKLLQGFTSDPEVLRALVAGKKANPGASPLMNNPVSGDEPGAEDTLLETAGEALGNSPDKQTILSNLQQFEAEVQSFQLQLRARYTLNALNLLARYLSNLPGRKNLIWFSGSFPISILPDPDLKDPFAVVASAGDEFRETADLFVRSQVAVYPIDARGLMVGMGASNTSGTTSQNSGIFAVNNNLDKLSQLTAGEHGTMEQMAQATGGKAFENTNNLTAAIEKAIEAGSNYYTVAYSPTNHDWNGSYRKIEVKVDRPGVTLAYRRGYYADELVEGKHHKEEQQGKPDAAQYSAIPAAMKRGAPDPTEIIFSANVRPSTADAEPALAAGNQASGKASGPFRRYTVHFMIKPNQFACPATPEGVLECILEFRTFVYDNDGTLINVQGNRGDFDIPAAEFTELSHPYLGYVQQISVPVKGEYFLRIGVRDRTNDRIGALELPVAAVAGLKPLEAPGAAPAAAAAPK